MKHPVSSVLNRIEALGRLRGRGFDKALCRDIASDDATRLGANNILYGTTH
jgi:hypothetical protein